MLPFFPDFLYIYSILFPEFVVHYTQYPNDQHMFAEVKSPFSLVKSMIFLASHMFAAQDIHS